MKNIIGFVVFFTCILASSMAIACDRCGHHHNSEREIWTEIGKVAAREGTKQFVRRLLGSSPTYYSNYNNYRYDEYEMARRQGFEEARQRDFEEKRWQQEQIRQQRIENARLEGEMLYNQRHGGRRY